MSSDHGINPPLFASANNRSNGHQPGDPPAWLMDGNDPLDVDLLAEYLLDDGKPAPNGMTFDFSIDAGTSSSVVSPEQSEDGGFPPVAETNHPPHHQSHLAPYEQMTGMSAPPSLASTVPGAPAPTTYAPAPVHHAQVIAPAPLMNGAQDLMVHQHGNFPKRQRVDNVPVPVPGVSPIPSAPPTTSSIVSGGQHMVAAAQAAMQQGGRGRKKSQAQIDRRRERNRILARRTRLRKKFFFESLQKEVMDLQRQNAALKDLVKSKFSLDESRKVLETCKASEKLPEAVVEACGELSAEMEQHDFNLVRSVQQSQHSFVITDPCLQDNPIVFASDGFLKVTGYAREDVLGRNCRFLQGPETSKSKLDAIRRALSVAEDITVTMVNYMADGTPFWNKLFIAALRDSSNNIVNFIGVIVRVASPPEGDPEFGKVLAVDGEQANVNENSCAHSTEANAMSADGAIRAIEGGMTTAVAAAAHMP